MNTPRFSLFPNGTSHMIWDERNCSRCIKGYDPNKHTKGRSDCDIENAIGLASATDGTLLHDGYTPINKADAIARRLNWDGHSYLEERLPGTCAMTALSHLRAQSRQHSARYRARNKRKIAAYARVWRLSHPGYSTPYVRAYRAGKEQ